MFFFNLVHCCRV